MSSGAGKLTFPPQRIVLVEEEHPDEPGVDHYALVDGERIPVCGYDYRKLEGWIATGNFDTEVPF